MKNKLKISILQKSKKGCNQMQIHFMFFSIILAHSHNNPNMVRRNLLSHRNLNKYDQSFSPAKKRFQSRQLPNMMNAIVKYYSHHCSADNLLHGKFSTTDEVYALTLSQHNGTQQSGQNAIITPPTVSHVSQLGYVTVLVLDS